MRQYTIKELKTIGTELEATNSLSAHAMVYRCPDWAHGTWNKSWILHAGAKIFEFKPSYEGKEDVIFINQLGYTFCIPLSEFKRIGLVKFPEDWFLRFDNETQFEIARDFLGKDWKYFPRGGMESYEGCKGISWLPSSRKDPKDKEEITFKEFEQEFIKATKTTMEKKIVEYKKTIECKKIIGYKAPFDMMGAIKEGQIYISTGSGKYYKPDGISGSCYELPKEIVEKWEPVYEEEYKIGDIVIASITGSRELWIGKYAGKKDERHILLDDWTGLEAKSQSYSTGGLFSKVERKASPLEIDEYSLIKVGPYFVVKEGSKIKVGCKLFTREQFDVINRLVTDTEILADITIRGTKIDKELLDKISKIF